MSGTARTGFMSASTGYTSLLTTWLNKKFISDLEWMLQYKKFTTDAIIPPGSGKIGRFNVFAAPPAGTSYSTSSTTALDETWTTQNEIATISSTGTDITVTEYGEFHKTSALMMYAAVSGAREKLLKRLKDGAAITIDTLVRAQTITDGTNMNYVYASVAQTGGTTTFNTGTVTTAGAALLMLAKKQLVDDLVPPFTDVPGHPKGKFAAILSTKQELDIVTEVTTGRVYWSNAVVNVPGAEGQLKFVEGYIGTVYGVATYTTQNSTTGNYTASSSGEIGVVIGDGHVGALGFRDMEPKVVINDVNSPYKNVDSVAWHVFFGVGQIDARRICKMYSAS